ncbi:CRISPR-associated endonuclease Cas1 [Methylococcus geothermalis]|uniref:CRISPR-associated endonuclease Cas1 n=1 Tax=Methylococcus geothermalis TaxID=2681310 RepID=A0A858Q9F4_9GAMM|nr:CRISPR-associated endonuclease Cas1 [Methylococcus geothermalis]QJD30453.1 CRISPR-associated endonuclease Cas1 [Methylococcus geothermalis]
MGTLYLDRKDLELRHEGKHLCLYENGAKSGTVPINLIDRVVIRGAVTLSAGAIGALTEEGVGLVLLSGRHGKHMATVLGRPQGDAWRRIGQYRWYHHAEDRGRWARSLVLLKLRAQQRMLTDALSLRPDCRKPIKDAQRTLTELLGKVQALPLDTGTLASLRGLEGAAAAAHFNALQSLFPPALGFTGRNRRPPRDPVNAVLSLAYTLLHFEAVAACHAGGLDPYIGFYHEPAYNRESLAADLIEPLRAHIDGWVWRLFADRVLRDEHFTRAGDTCLLGKAGRERFYSAFEIRCRPLRRLLRRYVHRIAMRLVDDHDTPRNAAA